MALATFGHAFDLVVARLAGRDQDKFIHPFLQAHVPTLILQFLDREGVNAAGVLWVSLSSIILDADWSR